MADGSDEQRLRAEIGELNAEIARARAEADRWREEAERHRVELERLRQTGPVKVALWASRRVLPAVRRLAGKLR